MLGSIIETQGLLRAARSPADYADVQERGLAEADQPVILNWREDVFDHGDVAAAVNICFGVIPGNAKKFEGTKTSPLDESLRLPCAGDCLREVLRVERIEDLNPIYRCPLYRLRYR